MLGLRHIVEDGVKLLEGGRIARDRRQYVLAQLKSFIDQASRGSALVEENAWFIPPSDREALESFSLINKYLNARGPKLRQLLDATRESIERLETGRPVAKADFSKAHGLMTDVLECIRQDMDTISEQWDQRIGIPN